MSINDNKGFSFVELMVSIAIVAFAIVPIIQSMTSAAMVNKKTKAVQDATIIAQNITETFKAVDLLEMIEGLQNATSSPYNNITGQYVESCNVTEFRDDGTGTFVEGAPDLTQVAPKYKCILDVKVHDMIYNVSVVLDSAFYDGGGGINTFEEPKIIDLDKHEKAIIKDEVMLYDVKAAKYFINTSEMTDRSRLSFEDMETHISYTDLDGIEGNEAFIEKKLVIDVSMDGAKYKVTGGVIYSISIPYINVRDDVDEHGDPILIEELDFTPREWICSNLYTGEFDELPNIYLLSTIWQGNDDSKPEIKPDRFELNIDNTTVVLGTDIVKMFLIQQNNDASDKVIPIGNLPSPDVRYEVKVVPHDDYEEIGDSIITNEPKEIRLYNIYVEVSNKNISPVTLTSTKEE